MSAPTNTPWTVHGCGNPEHGPKWDCHKVKDSTGAIILRDVTREVAERYASVPALVADNAALLQAVLDSLDVPLSPEMRRLLAERFRAEPHPGATLLGRVMRLEEAVAWCCGYFQRFGDDAALATVDDKAPESKP
jgi:hypothetical protein